MQSFAHFSLFCALKGLIMGKNIAILLPAPVQMLKTLSGISKKCFCQSEIGSF